MEGNKIPLVTTNHIVNGTLTLIKVKLGQAYAVEFGTKIRDSKFTTIVFVSPKDEEQAWDIFKKYSNKDWSFVDCSSFAIMQRLKIDTVFAFDPHFKQMGLNVLP
jgi:predicted nucleic acid-binding protein